MCMCVFSFTFGLENIMNIENIPIENTFKGNATYNVRRVVGGASGSGKRKLNNNNLLIYNIKWMATTTLGSTLCLCLIIIIIV